MKRYIACILLICFGFSIMAQTKELRQGVRKGNREYKKERFDNAETAYRKVLAKDSTNYIPQYNLGNAMYRKAEKTSDVASYDEALKHYRSALENPKLMGKDRSHAFHNCGNCHLKKGLQDRQNGMEEFQQAVNSYQEALKIDPKNADTKYNLSYAKKLLAQAQQQQSGGGGNNNGQDKKNNQQQQQQQNQNQDKQQNKDQNQQQQNQDQKKDKGQQQQHQPNESQRKDAERLLKAMENNEKNTMKEVQKKAEKVSGKHTDKDW